MKIGVAIAIRREEIGMTQEELAKAVGVSKATISRWESGDISNMRRDRIQSLASALNVSPLSLLDDEPSSLAEPQFEAHAGVKKIAALVDDQSGKDEDEIRAMCRMLSDDSLLMLREYTRFLLWREAQAAEDSE